MTKPHHLKGKKKSAESIRKMLATRAERKAARERGEAPPVAKATKPRKPRSQFVSRSLESLERDVKEALWCIDRAVAGTRRKIRSGELSLTDVTDEETFLYMAKRYLEGGLKP